MLLILWADAKKTVETDIIYIYCFVINLKKILQATLYYSYGVYSIVFI